MDIADPYTIFYPVQCGYLNCIEGHPIQSVLSDLQIIWEYAISEKLNLSLDELKVLVMLFFVLLLLVVGVAMSMFNCCCLVFFIQFWQ